MAEVKVVFWSGTGNTAAMAEIVKQGAAGAGVDAVLIPAEEASAADLAGEKALALGCPSMGAEQLEESVMEPLVEELLPALGGKKVLLFGSYGWGDGEWMRNWVEQVSGAGAELIVAEGVICNDAPDADAQEALTEAGRLLGEAAK